MAGALIAEETGDSRRATSLVPFGKTPVRALPASLMAACASGTLLCSARMNTIEGLFRVSLVVAEAEPSDGAASPPVGVVSNDTLLRLFASARGLVFVCGPEDCGL